MSAHGTVSIVLALLVAIASPAGGQQVYKSVTTDKLEKILAELKVDYKKTSGDKANVHFYDFTRNGFKIRLHNYEGKDLWIDALFTDPVAPEDVNRWNVRAKFSRAVLLKDKNAGKTTVSLENQFDCTGGCTDAFVRQFIVRFDGEVRDFAEFVRKTMPR